MFHLIAVFAVGFAAAGFLMLGARLTGRRAGKGLILVAAGVAMISYAIWSEYSWYSRTRDGLPARVQVVETFDVRSPLQPWTYLIPRTNRFVAVDTGAIRTNPAMPEGRMLELILVERLEPTRTVPLLIDCKGARQTEIAAGGDFTDNGLPKDPNWRPLPTAGPLYGLVCAGGGG